MLHKTMTIIRTMNNYAPHHIGNKCLGCNAGDPTHCYECEHSAIFNDALKNLRAIDVDKLTEGEVKFLTRNKTYWYYFVRNFADKIDTKYVPKGGFKEQVYLYYK